MMFLSLHKAFRNKSEEIPRNPKKIQVFEMLQNATKCYRNTILVKVDKSG